MKAQSARKGIVWTALLVLLALASTGAVARPISPTSDRSDNTMTFTYNSVTGEMEQAASSKTLSRKDRLDFIAMVRSDPEEEVGERLTAHASLRLIGRRAVELKGTLAVVVQNDAGATVESLERAIDFVLRDRKGKRSKSFDWTFDLPAGNYTVFGTFEK